MAYHVDAEMVRDALMLRSLQASPQLIAKYLGHTNAREVNQILKGGKHWNLLSKLDKMSEKSEEELWETLTAWLAKAKKK